jgi:hypothetical protein
MVLLLSVRLMAQLQLSVELKPNRSAFIMCEPQYLSIVWQSTSESNLYIGQALKPTDSPTIGLLVDSVLLKKLPGISMVTDYKVSAPDYLRPGEKRESLYNMLYLNLKPGNHTIQAVADFQGGPAQYFHGIVESNAVKFEILSAQAEDHNAVQAMWTSLQNQQIACGKSSSKEPIAGLCYFMVGTSPEWANTIITKFPSSIYAAWAVLGTSEMILSTKNWKEPKNPERLFLWVDPPKPETKSRLDAVEATLRSPQGFPFLADLRYMQISLLLQLERQKEAVKRLEEYSKADDKETAECANKYLEAYRALKKEGKIKY